MARCAGCLAVLALALPQRGSCADAPEKVIVLSRHGVRRQFPSSVHDFSKYAPGKEFATEDEDWGVDGSMGVLTQHGYNAAVKMGEYQGLYYKNVGFKINKCSNMFVYSEEDMPRDIFTAKAFFTGFAETYGSKCPPPESHSELVEYLIDQGSAPRGEHCALGTEQEVGGRMGQNVDEYTRLYQTQLVKLGNVLGCCDQSLCDGLGLHAKQKCTLLQMKHTWDTGHWYDTYLGPVYAGKYFAEWFELTYLNGMEAAWGLLTEQEIMDLSSFVTLYRQWEFDMLAARPFGSALALHVLASLEAWTEDGSGAAASALAHPVTTDMVYYAAHDTNLLYVAELLDLKWLNKGWQPNHTPPGGMLVFELYKTSGGGYEVGVFFDVQTPSQIRNLTTMSLASPPSRARVTVPGCGAGVKNPLNCPLPRFRELVLRAIQLECVMVPELKAWGQSLSEKYLGGGSSSGGGGGQIPGDLTHSCDISGQGAGPSQALLFGVAAGAALFGIAAGMVCARALASKRRAAGAGKGGRSGGISMTGRNGHVEEFGLLSDNTSP